MGENKTLVPVVGGSTGWGGLVDTNGDSIIPSNASSDCLNVYEDNGILKKRLGYTTNTGAFVLGGAYEAASTGNKQLTSYSHVAKLSQELYLTGAGSGADIDFTGSATDLVVAMSLQGANPWAGMGVISAKLYTVDGSGHPNTLLATSYNLRALDINSASEKWVYYVFPTATLSTANVCLTLESFPAGDYAETKWHFSNGGGGYAPGGARVSAYWNGAAWVDIVGTDFKFKFFYKITSQNFKSLFQYKALTSFEEHNSLLSFAGQSGNGTTATGTALTTIEDYTVFPEGEVSGYSVMSGNSITGPYFFFGYFPQAKFNGAKNTLLSKSRLVLGTENYLFWSSYNECCLRIAKFNTANNRYAFANIPYGMIISPDKNVPQIWGSTTYPISGYAGAAVFTGLTNPITLASTVMWHGHKLWYGDVTINSVSYPNRIYYSGTDSPEAGYTDTNFITINGKVTALVDVGDYAILADSNNTYLYLGGAVPSTSEMVQHPPSGGVYSQEAMCKWSGADGSLVVFGWGSRGIFKIDRANKVYLNDKIIDKISNLIQGNVYACPDYARGMILFSYTILGVRKILALNVASGTWWTEDIDATNMISVDVGNCTIPKIVGLKSNQWLNMYTGSSDDGTFIKAYYKTGPLYINDTKFKPRNFFVKYKNEPTISHLDVKYNLDYGTDTVKTLQNGNSTVTSNVPFIKKADAHGEASSTEVTLYQDKVTTTVNVNSASGQAVLSVASITGFIVGHKVIINDGGAREETKVISAIGAASLTFTANLTYTHTAAQADSVDTYDESFSVASVDMEIYGSNKVPQDL